MVVPAAVFLVIAFALAHRSGKDGDLTLGSNRTGAVVALAIAAAIGAKGWGTSGAIGLAFAALIVVAAGHDYGTRAARSAE